MLKGGNYKMIKLSNDKIIKQLQEENEELREQKEQLRNSIKTLFWDYEEETQKLKDRIELLENSLDDNYILIEILQSQIDRYERKLNLKKIINLKGDKKIWTETH